MHQLNNTTKYEKRTSRKFDKDTASRVSATTSPQPPQSVIPGIQKTRRVIGHMKWYTPSESELSPPAKNRFEESMLRTLTRLDSYGGEGIGSSPSKKESADGKRRQPAHTKDMKITGDTGTHIFR